MKKALIIGLSLLNFVACSRNHYKDVKVDGYYFQSSNQQADFQGSRAIVDIHNGKMTMYEFSSDFKKYKTTTADVSSEGRKATFKNFKSDCDNDFEDQTNTVSKKDGVLSVSAEYTMNYIEIGGKDAESVIQTLKSGTVDCSVSSSFMGSGSPAEQRKDFALLMTMNQITQNKSVVKTESVSDEIFSDKEKSDAHPKYDSGE